MSKHTPAPWTAMFHEPTEEYHVQGKRNDGGSHIATVSDWGDEGPANARLIYAAPDMLAALKIAHDELLVHVRRCGERKTNDAMLACRAAIAKAEGREP